MDLCRLHKVNLLIFYCLTFFSYIFCEVQAIGTCSFDELDWLCGYTQSPTDNFNWSHVDFNNNYCILANSTNQIVGSKAELKSPAIVSKDTHCFTFAVQLSDERKSKQSGNVSDVSTSSQLNVYIKDNEIGATRLSVWNSSRLERNLWKSVELALTPRSYQVIFEAITVSSQSGYVAIDNITVSSSSCNAAPHFLRLGDKAVNVGQNETLQCLLWGHRAQSAHVILQKSTGQVFQPSYVDKADNHLIVSFRFLHVTAGDSGVYRCVSDNITEVGVSNYARLGVKVPPTPRLGPKVVEAGPTYLKIELNTEDFSGDGPIVQTILIYRPVDGAWSDVHEITTSDYDLWHLQPDTEYELAVSLVRPGEGGTGFPGPPLRKKTKCGKPTKSVEMIAFAPIGHVDPVSMNVSWNAPDFSITQCHNFNIVVRYGVHSTSFLTNSYQNVRVQNENFVVIHGLKPATVYDFYFELANAAEQGSAESGPYIAQTSDALPGPVPKDFFEVVSFNESAITVQWIEPDAPNGKILKYKILHLGISSHDTAFHPQNDEGLFEVSGSERNLTLSPLHPGTTYNISIQATNSAGNGTSIFLTAHTSVAPPIMPQYPPINNNATDVVSTPTTIEVTILPAQGNGAPISSYYVIVVEDQPQTSRKGREGKKKNAKRGKGRKKKGKNRSERSLVSLLRNKRQADMEVMESNVCYKKPLTYEEALAKNKTYYSPANFSPDQIEQDTKFVVGAGSSYNGFENPALDPSKKYRIYIRVESVVDGKKFVNCQLVAVKSIAPPTTTTSPTTTPVPTLAPDDDADSVETNQDNNLPTNSTADREATEQKRTMMYTAVGGTIGAILIILIIVIIFVVLRIRKKNRKEEVVNPFEVRLVMSDVNNPGHTMLPIGQSETDNSDRQMLMPDLVGYEHQDFLDKGSDGSTPRGYATTSNDERFALRVDDFHVHVSQMKASGGYGFRDEFSSFTDGPTAPWTVATSTLNKNKNRYSNVLAYDHSRVVLDLPPQYEGEFSSDYINASYVNGYKRPSMYIATQAPSSNTINDFWLMIWQEKTNIIVMVTNMVEMGRIKCEKYWPDDRAVFGNIDVSMNSEVKLSDYVVRTFVLQQLDGYDVREVKQFHFTAWPDHGVPSRPTSLLTFIRKIKSCEPQGQGPTVVHCSAGAGRTGCFIVIDMMLDMAREEDIVDIHNTVRDLRSRRVNMVQTEDQYVFIHEAVLEALLCGETLVAASDLVRHYDELITVDPQTHLAPIQEEFETLNVITPKLADDEYSIARLPRNRNKNRFMDVLPADRHLAYLVTSDPQDRDNTYINSVFVDSYFRSNSLLVTQMPLPNTVMDIWRLVYDHRCTSIVMMNDVSEHDQTCAQYWPDTGSIIIGPFTVELLTKDDEVDVVCRLFKLQNVTKPGETYRLVQHFQVTNWPAAQPVPYSRNSVLRVIQLVMKWQSECAKTNEPGKTLVHCVAGAGRSGTFVSCFNMCEQLRHEYAVDIFNIVQSLRNVRPQLVETLEQYRFCYEVGIEFVER